MAFSLAGIAVAADPEEKPEDGESHTVLTWGEPEPCENEPWKDILIPQPGSRILAAYVQDAMRPPYWVRVVQRGDRLRVETSTSPGRDRSVGIDPEDAERIHKVLAADLARNAFKTESEELQVDGVWYTFTADGITCSVVPWMTRTDRSIAWSGVFEAIYDRSPASQASLRFWLDNLEEKPATLPTSLKGAQEDVVIPGAPSSWESPNSAPMAIANHHARLHEGSFEIVGEVVTRMDPAREDASVVATFLDSNGTVLDTEEEDLAFDLLPKGTRSPFTIEAVVVDREDVASYTLRIEPGRWANARFPTIRVTQHKARNDDDDLVVTGTVRNDGKSDEENIKVCALLYDAAGHLLAVDDDYLSGTLKAGATAAFEVSVERPPGYHHYEVIVNPEYREPRE